MKKTFAYLLLLPFACAGFMACEKDEHALTGENGRPSNVTYVDTSIEYSYTNQRLTQIREKGITIRTFHYKGDELDYVSFTPDDPRIADGNGSNHFKREGNIITIQSWGEPSFNQIEFIMELDEHDLPVKITVNGGYSNNSGTIEKTVEGRQYALFSIDPSTRNLLKQEIFDKQTNERIALYEYEYENTPGAMSKSSLPLWYHIWIAYGLPYASGDDRDLFLNYVNNIRLKKVNDSRYDQPQKTVRYRYTYNKDGFPITQTCDDGLEEGLSIRY